MFLNEVDPDAPGDSDGRAHRDGPRQGRGPRLPRRAHRSDVLDVRGPTASSSCGPSTTRTCSTQTGSLRMLGSLQGPAGQGGRRADPDGRSIAEVRDAHRARAQPSCSIRWNDTDLRRIPLEPIHVSSSRPQAVNRTPDATAVIFPGRRRRHRAELRASSTPAPTDSLAAPLVAQGREASNDLVGVCLDALRRLGGVVARHPQDRRGLRPARSDLSARIASPT